MSKSDNKTTTTHTKITDKRNTIPYIYKNSPNTQQNHRHRRENTTPHPAHRWRQPRPPAAAATTAGGTKKAARRRTATTKVGSLPTTGQPQPQTKQQGGDAQANPHEQRLQPTRKTQATAQTRPTQATQQTPQGTNTATRPTPTKGGKTNATRRKRMRMRKIHKPKQLKDNTKIRKNRDTAKRRTQKAKKRTQKAKKRTQKERKGGKTPVILNGGKTPPPQQRHPQPRPAAPRQQTTSNKPSAPDANHPRAGTPRRDSSGGERGTRAGTCPRHADRPPQPTGDDRPPQPPEAKRRPPEAGGGGTGGRTATGGPEGGQRGVGMCVGCAWDARGTEARRGGTARGARGAGDAASVRGHARGQRARRTRPTARTTAVRWGYLSRACRSFFFHFRGDAG